MDILLASIMPFLPYAQSYGWIPGVYLWSLFTIAPWFFMLARLKNMGYHTDRASVKRLYRELGLLTTLSVLPFSVFGIVADVIFNAINGTLIFRELPREGLFTQRVERWDAIARESIGDMREARGVSRRQGFDPTDQELKELRRRERMGIRWAKRLNSIMPGHV